MKKLSWIFMVCFTMMMSACSTEDEWEVLEQQNTNKVVITASIEQTEKSSRTMMDKDGSGVFETGDGMRLFTSSIYGYNDIFYGDNQWQHDLSWDSFQGETTTFTAFSPILNQNVGKFIHTVQSDQRNIENFKKSDLLFATTTVNHGDRVELKFKHIMSRVKVKLNSNYYSDEQLSKARISVLAATQVYVNSENGEVLPYSRTKYQDVQLHYAGDNTFEVILCPQELMSIDYSKWMNITIAGKAYVYPIPQILADGTPLREFKSGQEVSMTLNFIDETSRWKNTTAWVYGVKNPSFDDKEKWGYAFVDNQDMSHRALGLTWQREYGWYDCNKKDPTGPAFHDQNLCWAATSANMLHWWLHHNKGFLVRYGEYHEPHEYRSSTESDIFDYYKKNHPDEGYFLPAGVNWYLTKDTHNNRPGGGFFRKVFGEKTVVTSAGFTGRDPKVAEQFSAAIKGALRDRQAIGCSFDLPNGSSHAINFWGAEFDENGIVTALYMVDNNDIGWEEQNRRYVEGLDRPIVPTGLFRKPIKFIDGLVYMESAAKGKFTQRLDQLVFLGLLQDEWNVYLYNNGK